MDRQMWGKLVERLGDGEADKGFVGQHIGDGQADMGILW